MKKILIGVSSGIAIYKTCSLVRLFVNEGCQVKVVMTPNATKLVSPLTFEALTHSPVFYDSFEGRGEEALLHLKLANWPDVFIVAPATANTLGKIANGIADNLLTTIVLALPSLTPLILVPAMNVNMWENPLVQENIKKLKKVKNYFILEPKEGVLAEGIEGKGRMPEPKEIFEFVRKLWKEQKKN